MTISKNTLEYKASKIYTAQLQRCNNPNTRGWKWYGLRGIKVVYSRDQFVRWFIKEIKKRKLISPNVSRIDHSKNYSFDNIEMIERFKNIQERNNRVGLPNPGKPVDIYEYWTGRLLATAVSTHAAEMLTGIGQDVIWACINKGKTRKQSKDFIFKYKE